MIIVNSRNVCYNTFVILKWGCIVMFLNIINEIGDIYPIFKNINNIVGSVLSAMLIYKTVYFLIGVFFTRKFNPAKKKHKYAIVIAARNEEAVIGNLLDSIKKQDYPSELITTL